MGIKTWQFPSLQFIVRHLLQPQHLPHISHFLSHLSFATCEASTNQETPSKNKVGLVVVLSAGHSPAWQT